MNITDYISDEQLNQIVSVIKNRCLEFKKLEMAYKKLVYAPYMKRREKYSLTGLILCAFSPEQMRIAGMTVSDVNYGAYNGLVQPELRSKNAILQIYSDAANVNRNKIVKERCSTYNSSEEAPIFLILKFKINKKIIF